MLQLFDICVLSCEVHLVKPDPAIFRYTLEKLGLEAASVKSPKWHKARSLNMRKFAEHIRWPTVSRRSHGAIMLLFAAMTSRSTFSALSS
jgi:hypothetical protein